MVFLTGKSRTGQREQSPNKELAINAGRAKGLDAQDQPCDDYASNMDDWRTAYTTASLKPTARLILCLYCRSTNVVHSCLLANWERYACRMPKPLMLVLQQLDRLEVFHAQRLVHH